MADFLNISFDIGHLILRLFFFGAIFLVAILTAKDEWTKKRRKKLAIPLFIIVAGVLCPLLQSAQDMLYPVVSSERLIRHKSDFEFVSSRNQYRVCFPKYGKIEDVDVFYTGYYDAQGKHTGRMTWVKYIDFGFFDDCIQSKHNLENAQGEHTIVLKYRTWIGNYFSAKRKAEASLNF